MSPDLASLAAPPPQLDEVAAGSFSAAALRAWQIVAPLPIDSTRLPRPPGWWSRRKLARAQIALAHCLQLAPAAPMALWGMGRLLFAKGDPQGAHGFLQRALDGAPHQPQLALELSHLAATLGDLQGAERWARRVVDQVPDDAAAMVHYIESLVAAGHLKRALGVAVNHLRRHPEDHAAQRVLQHVRAHIDASPTDSADPQR